MIANTGRFAASVRYSASVDDIVASTPGSASPRDQQGHARYKEQNIEHEWWDVVEP
jgi:hypothetical protein